jgi:hypothetical protein
MALSIKPRYVRRTAGCSPADGSRPSGALSGLAVLFLLLFSILGLGLMTSSQIYMELSHHRKNSLLLRFAVENGVKLGFHRLIDRASPLLPISGSELAAIREDAGAEGTLTCFLVFGGEDELTVEEGWRNLYWHCRPRFRLDGLEEDQGFFRGDYSLFLDSEGRIEAYPVRKGGALRLRLGILAGRIPLSSIPLLMAAPQSSEERELLLKSIRVYPEASSILPPEPFFTDSNLLPKSVSSFLAGTLKIKMFTPENLSRAQIRQAIGLEISSDPIPEGVYLIEDDLGLGGLYIQGDIIRLTLAAGEDFQMMDFETEAGNWVLQYSPQNSTTVFITPDEIRRYNLIPRGFVFSTGDILSMGAGVVDPSGLSLLPSQEKIPCLMRGISLTIVSPKSITLTSHLIRQGVEWTEGIPYLKGKSSQLHLFAAGRDAQGREDKDRGGIQFSPGDAEEMEIHASLTAGGRGISFKGRGKLLRIFGSLHGRSVSTEGTIHLFPRSIPVPPLNEWGDQPQTALPVLYLTHLETVSWEDK